MKTQRNVSIIAAIIAAISFDEISKLIDKLHIFLIPIQQSLLQADSNTHKEDEEKAYLIAVKKLNASEDILNKIRDFQKIIADENQIKRDAPSQ